MPLMSEPGPMWSTGDPSALYQLLDKLGQGSYGEVYSGVERSTGRIVAVKIVPIEGNMAGVSAAASQGTGTGGTDPLAALLHEIDTLRSVSSGHPNIVNYFGSWLSPSGAELWIVMENCQGGSLTDLFCAGELQGLSEPQVADVLAQVVDGLAFLHAQRIVHRDLKASNVLLTEDGHAKLADFGVAARLTSSISKRRTVVGSPFWMAPEVIQESAYDARADMWSLGITAIEIAEGRPPLSDVHPMRALFLIPTRPPPTLTELKAWSPEFSDFLRLCLAKNPVDRPCASSLLSHPFIAPARARIAQDGTSLLLAELVEGCMPSLEAARAGNAAAGTGLGAGGGSGHGALEMSGGSLGVGAGGGVGWGGKEPEATDTSVSVSGGPHSTMRVQSAELSSPSLPMPSLSGYGPTLTLAQDSASTGTGTGLSTGPTDSWRDVGTMVSHPDPSFPLPASPTMIEHGPIGGDGRAPNRPHPETEPAFLSYVRREAQAAAHANERRAERGAAMSAATEALRTAVLARTTSRQSPQVPLGDRASKKSMNGPLLIPFPGVNQRGTLQAGVPFSYANAAAEALAHACERGEGQASGAFAEDDDEEDEVPSSASPSSPIGLLSSPLPNTRMISTTTQPMPAQAHSNGTHIGMDTQPVAAWRVSGMKPLDLSKQTQLASSTAPTTATEGESYWSARSNIPQYLRGAFQAQDSSRDGKHAAPSGGDSYEELADMPSSTNVQLVQARLEALDALFRRDMAELTRKYDGARSKLEAALAQEGCP